MYSISLRKKVKKKYPTRWLKFVRRKRKIKVVPKKEQIHPLVARKM